MVQIGIGHWLADQVGQSLHLCKPIGDIREMLHEGGSGDEFHKASQKSWPIDDNLLINPSGW